jgi:outer membrane lipoprotein-sorting protein
MVVVCDGETVFQELSLMGKVQVVKTKPENLRSGIATGGETLAERLRKQGEVILLPDEAVDGTPVYVVEVVLNEKARQRMPGAAARTRLWFAKETGARLRIESFNKAGESLSVIAYSDPVFGPELDPSRFEYSPPKGVSVVDVSDRKLDSVPVPF